MGLFGSKFKCDQCDSKFGKEEELLSHAKQSHGVDVQDYNIESGKDYSGQSKFKSIADNIWSIASAPIDAVN